MLSAGSCECASVASTVRLPRCASGHACRHLGLVVTEVLSLDELFDDIRIRQESRSN
jgi:hypothetical protein